MKKGRRVPGTAELDVIPVMSLIVHLIPMLLLSVRFITLSKVEAKGPLLPTTPAPSDEAYAEQESDLVAVRITAEGFVVTGDEAADPRIPCKGACTPDTYDYEALGRAMVAAKRLHPAEQRVVVAPDPIVAYDVMVRVMDVARGEAGQPLFPIPLIAAGVGE